MKKIIISLVFSVALAVYASAQSGSGTASDPFYGTISTSVTWDMNNFPGGVIYIGKTGVPASTYNDITVNSGGHLTIGPGITIIFLLTTSDLIITGSGILTANGTSSSSIVFTKDSSISHWGHISFETPGTGTPITGTGTFAYCLVEYGYAATTGTNPDNAGGGIQVNASNVTITNCTFQNDYSNFGGAVTVNASENTIISNSYFKSNTANEAGGAVLLWTSSTALVENCVFEANHSTGTSYNLYSGGAIWLLSNSSTIINCTFVNNTSAHPGDAVFSYTSFSATIKNSIFWGSNNQFATYGTPPAITNCAFQSTKPSTALNSIIINSSNSAPDGPNFTATDGTDWSIKFISPCRDAGTSSGAPTTDYLGKPRVGNYDIGAYEVQYSRWTGATNTDWYTGTNWDAGIDPLSGTGDVIIPSGLTNYPIGSAPSFVIVSGKYMILNPGAQATFSSLRTNGTLKLESDASGISSLIINSGSGTATVDLYLTGGNPGAPTLKLNKWHFISSPVSSLPVSTFAPTYTLNVAGWYDNRVTASLAQGWVAYDGYIYATGSSGGPTFSNLTPGNGYDYYATTDLKYTFSGTLNTSDVPMSLSYNANDALHGFNLLGNPFSSGLNWDDIINNVYFTYPPNTSKSLYFTRNNSQCSYISGVGIPSDVNGIIPPMQGFFVKTYSTGNTITLPAGGRVQGSIHARYKGLEIIPLVRLSLAQDTLTDETVVRFAADAKSGLDYDYDAPKMFLSSDNLSIYSTSEGSNFAINGLPFPDTLVKIPIIVNLTASGKHTITATQLQGLDNYDVALTDSITGFTANLKTTPVLTFSADAGTIANRFILKVGTISTGIENPVVSKYIFNIYPANKMINIQTLSDIWDGKTGSVRVLDLTGKIIGDLNNSEFSKNSLVQVPAPVVKGIYMVEIKSGVLRYVGKVGIR